MKLNILYQFNDAYAPYAGVSICSLLKNNQKAEAIEIYVLGEKLSSGSISRLRSLVKQYGRRITFLNSDRILKKIKELGIPKYRGSFAANMKLFFSSEISEEAERLLYIDSDTLVVDSLEALFCFPMKEYPLAMALDSLGKKHKTYIGLRKGDPYFNSGVILFDLKKWKELNCEKQLAEHALYSRAHYMSPDQDLINAALKGQIGRLDARFNFQPIHFRYSAGLYRCYWKQNGYYSAKELLDAKTQPVILHFFRFLGEFPWDTDSLHPYAEAFADYLKQSPWQDLPEKASVQQGAVFQIERFLYRLLPDILFMPVFRACYGIFLWKAERASRRGKNDRKM
ncbi:MAG TPA: glycosyltransferase family 8 protein [Candidatus Blautia intestinavium]|nr:glycosyltransferase family 8 protein [Candidatus Blautia intestinavium]HJC56206.1 glycosyltransferase family 8 protein [Candidatus Eisenbergiella intestinipullorum]